MMKGWRKYSIAAAALLFATLLCAIGKVSGGEYVTAVGLVLGLFGAGNVGERITERKNG